MDVIFMGSRDEALHMKADFTNQKISLWSTQNVSCIFDPIKIYLVSSLEIERLGKIY